MALRGEWNEDPERAEQATAYREAMRDYERALDAHLDGRHRLYDRDGMRCDPHPHDAPPSMPVEPFHIEDDPTGRHAYNASTSPTVMLSLACTAPDCTVALTLYGRAETVDAARRAGGPRCPAHALNPPASQAATKAEGGRDHGQVA